MGTNSRSTYSNSSSSSELKTVLVELKTLSNTVAAMQADKVAAQNQTPEVFYTEEQANLILQDEANWVQFPKKQDGPQWTNPNHSKHPGFNYADPNGCTNPAPFNPPTQRPSYQNNQGRKFF